MKKAFRWGCVLLSLIALCAWALLLHQARQPWKMIGVNDGASPDLDGTALQAEKFAANRRNASVGARTALRSRGEGDQTLDPLVVEQPDLPTESFNLHDARMFFMTGGPSPRKKRHHAKKSKDGEAETSSEKKDENADNTVSSGSDTTVPSATSVPQLVTPSYAVPSSPVLVGFSANTSSAVASVTKTTQTIAEKISAPITTTINGLTQGIPIQARLQNAVSSTQSTISQVTAPVTSTVSSLTSAGSLLASSAQALSSQTLSTVSAVTNTISSVTSGPSAPVTSSVSSVTPTVSTFGSPVSAMTTAPVSTVSAPSTTSMTAVSVAASNVTTAAPSLGSSFATAPISVTNSVISPSATTSAPASLSSSLLGTPSILPKGLPRGR